MTDGNSAAPPAPPRKRRWLARLILVLTPPVLLGTAIALWPDPARLLQAMWPQRTAVWNDIKTQSFESAAKDVRRWQATAAWLGWAVHLSGPSPSLDQQAAISDLIAGLKELRSAVDSRDSDRIVSRAARCFELHRRCDGVFSRRPSNLSSVPHAGHAHEKLEVPAEEAPAVTLAAIPDPVAGWNIHLTTTGFHFSPEHASGPHVPGEGHAHLFLDEKKVARVYGEWYHLQGVPSGRHLVRVSLNTNDHRDYTVKGVVVGAEVALGADTSPQLIYFGRASGSDDDTVGRRDELCLPP